MITTIVHFTREDIFLVQFKQEFAFKKRLGKFTEEKAAENFSRETILGSENY